MYSENEEYFKREALLRLLRIKDSDLRILTLVQGKEAVDRGIHIGGAFSAMIPLVSLYYGTVMRFNPGAPLAPAQDMFVLSKGHAVAALVSILADTGYIDPGMLKNTRSMESLINGHPGPLIPGIPLATGPEGHGLPVAQGFAIAGKMEPHFDVFALTGDGEIQAGMIWEAVMYSGKNRLDNLCLLVDKNEGQLDNPRSLAFPMPRVEEWFSAFGWRAWPVDATEYGGVLEALRRFKFGPRDGRPTAIICNTKKGWGGLSSFCVGHKVELPEALAEQELVLQKERRDKRVAEFFDILVAMEERGLGDLVLETEALAEAMNYGLSRDLRTLVSRTRSYPKTTPEKKSKAIPFDPAKLPVLEPTKEYAASWVLTECMKEYGKSGRVATVDADLASTSGLEQGLSWADSRKALNVGVAESNMLCVGEAFAILGYNTWVSTFCPFFDWRVMRRIAIGYQERKEVINAEGWLAEGHNLDLVFLATAPNFETRTNGSTHMGNDDALLFGELAHLKIVDLSCPNQLLGFIRWVMEGNKGLVYARILRAPSKILYGKDYSFEYRRGFLFGEAPDNQAFIVTSGRGVYEALTAAQLLKARGISIGVADMPSADSGLFKKLLDTGKPILLAEQNNGFLLKNLQEEFWNSRGIGGWERVYRANTRDQKGDRQYIHSATYSQLLTHFGLSAELLAERVIKLIES